MFWLSGAQPSNWEQSAQPGDQEERWLSKYRGEGEISSTWNSIEWCTYTCRSPVWKWFMIRRLTRWRLPFRNHTIDICHYFEFLNLDETVYVIRGSHYRIDICHYFDIPNSIWCHQGISQQYNQLRVASDGLMVENEEMRGNIMRRFEDENAESNWAFLLIQGRRDQREQRWVGRPAEGSCWARHRAEGEQNWNILCSRKKVSKTELEQCHHWARGASLGQGQS